VNVQALPKTKELSDDINRLVTGRKPSDFEIRLLKQTLGKLKDKIDYSDYYNLSGQIASLENNKQNIISHYENAIKLASNNYDIYAAYSIALYNRGFLLECLEQLKTLNEKFPTRINKEFLGKANSSACLFKTAISLFNPIKNNNQKYFNFAQEAVSICEKSDLSDNEAQYLCTLAYSLLETKSLYFSGYEVQIVQDCILYTIYVDLLIEEIFEINWELAGIFADNVEDMRSDVLMFEYSSVDVLEEKEKAKA